MNITGYGVLERDPNNPKAPRVVEAGVVRGAAKQSLADRLAEIHRGVADVIAALKPDVMALEQLYSHYAHPRTSILMGHARGVICLAAAQAGIPVVHYPATQIKRILTGSGRASKEQMQPAIRRELRLAACPSRPTWPMPWRLRFAIIILVAASKKLPTRTKYAVCSRRKRRAAESAYATIRVITNISGRLLRVGDESLTLQVGAFEYEVLIPEFARRRLQGELGQEISLHTIEYLEGNAMQGRMTPRLIGFLTEVEREFFDLVCAVDGVGVKKALRAMVRPVREVATAIEEQDIKALSGLPGVGPGHGGADRGQAAAKDAEVRADGGPRRAARDQRPSSATCCAKRSMRCDRWGIRKATRGG